MQAKTVATLRLKASGEVVGEIENEYGMVVSSRRFGVMTEDEFRKCLKLTEKVFLEVPSADAIEVIGKLLSLGKSESARGAAVDVW